MSIVFVGSDGLLKFVYDDELQPLLALGSAIVARASHVEPTPQGWTADMGPSGGPALGPFPRRDAALQAEVDWLQQRLSVASSRDSHGTAVSVVDWGK